MPADTSELREDQRLQRLPNVKGLREPERPKISRQNLLHATSELQELNSVPPTLQPDYYCTSVNLPVCSESAV